MRGKWLVVASVVLARIAFGYQFQSLAAVGPELAPAFGLDYATLGTLIGLYMVPGALVALPGGLLGRRYGERIVVGGGLLLMTLGSLAAGVASGPVGIGAGRAVAGVGAVALVVMQGKIVSDRFEGRAFLTVMGLAIGAFPIGVGLVGLLLEPLVAAAGWQGVFLVGAGIAGVAALLFACAAGPPVRLAGSAWALPSRRECRLVVVAGLVWTAYNAGYYGYLSYLPSLMAARGHPAAETALVLAIATWANLPATVAGGALAGRFGNRPVFLAGTLAGVLAVGGTAVLDWPLLWGALFGTVASLHAGVIVAVGTLSARPENRAVGMGLFYTTYYAGVAVVPALCGRAADWGGDPAWALAAAAALSAFALPIEALHRRLARQPIPAPAVHP